MGARLAGPVVLALLLLAHAPRFAAQAADPDRIVPALSATAARHPEDVRYIVRFGDAPLSIRLGDGARGREAFVAGRIASATSVQRAARSELDRAKRDGAVRSYRPLWIVNAIAVRSDAATMTRIATMPGVVEVIPDEPVDLFEAPATPPAGVATEWGVAKVGAPDAWALGIDGSGVTVGVIDTGVQWDHPALKAQYAGWDGATVDHNYAWFDALTGQPAPFDLDGHGTHVTGTLVGDGGEDNRIGVAPGARFIAARGCNIGSCSSSGLLAAMQWMLAPTDLNGANPDPSKAPRVVSNSWGASCTSELFRSAVQTWVAAGIVPVFANGNSGPEAGTVTAPACYPEAIGVGATDETDGVAPFSSRGPSPMGGSKPLVSAPGVVIRSSVPGNGYTFASGTSMAAPHVAGLVALILQADPSLDVALIAEVLASTSVDLGTPGTDDEFGAGRVDARAAVAALYDGPTEGTISGTVRDRSGAPIAGATVSFGSPVPASTTGPDGGFVATVPFGGYTVAVTAAGFEAASRAVSVDAATSTAPADFMLERAVTRTPGVTRFRLTSVTGNETATNRTRVLVAIETDDGDIVDGYMIRFDRVRPAPDDPSWRRVAPAWLPLPGGDGARTATLWLRDIAEGVHRVAVDSIVLDTSSPDISVENARSSSGTAAPAKRQVVRGRAVDAGSGVAAIRVAVRRGGAGVCEWWSPARQSFRPGPCGSPRWFVPQGTVAWRFVLSAGLQPATLYSRATDHAGNVSQGLTGIGMQRLEAR